MEELQKVFKTLGDPTRVRILRLLQEQELVVQELMEILGMAQSRVSRHLAILREANLVRDRRDGTYVVYAVQPLDEGPWRDTWRLVARNMAGDPVSERDDATLANVLRARQERSQSFFDAVGPEWDALRKVFDDDLLRARAVARLVPPGLRVVDLGTGTGVLAIELARLGLHVIGVDNSPRMLEAARAKVTPDLADAIEWRLADAQELPLGDGEADAVLGHMVLHSLDSPPAAIAEMARVLQPGGVAVLVDFVPHDREWMRQEIGAVWLGFDPAQIEGWLAEAGFEAISVEQTAAAAGRDLPATFIASARRSA